jgi:hypothetical protein
MSEPWPALCVFNPMTGDCTYLSSPPGIYTNFYQSNQTHILLTEADGIGCSFLLAVGNQCELLLQNR